MYLTPPNFTDLSFNMITTHTQKLRKIKTTFFFDPVRQMSDPDCKTTHNNSLVSLNEKPEMLAKFNSTKNGIVRVHWSSSLTPWIMLQ